MPEGEESTPDDQNQTPAAAADDQSDNGAAPEADPEGADKLGDPGKKALDAMKAKWKAAEKRAKDAEAEIANASRTPDERVLEETRESARAEATAKANVRILKAEIRAAAAGKLADPTDALRLLDMDDFEVGDEGEVDNDEIAAAIAKLIKSKPYLAAKQTGAVVPATGIDQGARDNSAPDIDAQIATAEKAGNYGLAISLKRQKAASAAHK